VGRSSVEDRSRATAPRLDNKGPARHFSSTGEFDEDADVDLEIERFISADRVTEWTAAAELVGLPLAEFVVVSLDRAAAAIKRANEDSS
jgi:hypothetical protein